MDETVKDRLNHGSDLVLIRIVVSSCKQVTELEFLLWCCSRWTGYRYSLLSEVGVVLLFYPGTWCKVAW